MKLKIQILQFTLIFLVVLSPCFAQQPEFVIDLKNRINLLQFSDDEKLLAVETGYDLAIYETGNGKLHVKLETPAGFSANSAIFSKDGKILITGNNDGQIRLFDTATFSLLKTFSVTQWSIYALAISQNNQILAADAADGTVQLWNIKTGKNLKTLGDKGQRMKLMSFSPNDEFLATVNLDYELNLWNVKTSAKVFSLKRSSQSPLIFCEQGKKFAITDYNSVDFLSVKNGEVTESFKIPKEYLPFTSHSGGGYFHGQIILSPDCRTIAISDWKNRKLTLFDIKNKNIKTVLDDSASEETSYIAVFSPSMQFIASGSTKGKVKWWRIK